jgi:D-alanyl-D-alanine carboxypeptidase/D-alanyl-D-alanine carboxypeptidase (penicillin-binding protein 5/6)
MGRRRGIFSLVVAAIIFSVCVFLPAPALAGYASIVVDEHTGAVVSEVNADQFNHPASLTKMMTLYLAFDALKRGKLRWDQPLRVSTWASEKSPTKLGLEPGDEITVRDCILGMIVLSANDAATVMGEALGGSEDGFARMMTERAHALGMAGTNFVNASGLPDEDQITTARDLAKLAVALHTDFPDDYHYFSTREFDFRGRLIVGHNHLMYRYPGMDGLKTGYTQASGFNLASSAERDGRRLVGIVMGGQSAWARDRLMATLLDDGFAGRETDPVLVAEAGGQAPRAGRRLLAGAARVLASLSPVTRAEAAPLPRGGRSSHVTPAIYRGSDDSDDAPEPAVTARQPGYLDRPETAKHIGKLVAHVKRPAAHAAGTAGSHLYHARLDQPAVSKQAHTACTEARDRSKSCHAAPRKEARIQLARARG